MPTPFQTPVQSLIQREGWKSQVAENSARLAFAYGRAETTGWGELKISECLLFDCSFIKQPFVAYSFSLDGDTLVNTRYPICSGGVVKWRTNLRGMFIGAWVMVTVQDRNPYINPTTLVHPNYAISHDFTFSGIAMKDIPPVQPLR